MTVNIAVTERLADWLCSESHDRLPATVKDKTVDVIFDAVGCMVACSALPEVNAIVEFVVQQGLWALLAMQRSPPLGTEAWAGARASLPLTHHPVPDIA